MAKHVCSSYPFSETKSNKRFFLYILMFGDHLRSLLLMGINIILYLLMTTHTICLSICCEIHVKFPVLLKTLLQWLKISTTLLFRS